MAKQRIRMANEKHSKNITQRGNVAKTLVRRSLTPPDASVTLAQTGDVQAGVNTAARR